MTGDYTLKWHAPDVRKTVIDELAENGEIVGKFVETDARRRLLAITEPEWGAKYRSQLVARLLTYEVEKLPKEVVIRIGVRATSKESHHGFYIELGSKTAPAHPFLRPAVYMNARQIVALLGGK